MLLFESPGGEQAVVTAISALQLRSPLCPMPAFHGPQHSGRPSLRLRLRQLVFDIHEGSLRRRWDVSANVTRNTHLRVARQHALHVLSVRVKLRSHYPLEDVSGPDRADSNLSRASALLT